MPQLHRAFPPSGMVAPTLAIIKAAIWVNLKTRNWHRWQEHILVCAFCAERAAGCNIMLTPYHTAERRFQTSPSPILRRGLRSKAANSLVSAVLVPLVFAGLLLAQTPIGFGPGTIALGSGLLDFFDWYAGSPSGCSTAQGPGGGSISSPARDGMCVGGLPSGDTMYFTAWFADASMLPVTTGLPIVGTVNDGQSRLCASSLFILQLAEFDWAARNASRLFEVNCMTSYGSDNNTPAGWLGHCTSNDNAGPDGKPCGWKSRGIFVRDGKLYLFVERQYGPGAPSSNDATMIMSADGGKTWKNPYTIFSGGSASATGDAPLCGAAGAAGGNPCTDTGYLDTAHSGAHSSIMWKALPPTIYSWASIEYGQDGATPLAGIIDGCDPATYTCFYGQPEGSLARVLNTDLPSLDVSKWQYYTCPAITDSYRCPGSASGSWTSTFTDRTPVEPQWSWSTVYLKEFRSYLMVAAGGSPGVGSNGTEMLWGPTAQGPWEPVASNPKVIQGFAGIILGAGYTVVSTDPPHIKLTVSSDDHYVHSPQATPIFSQWDVTLGKLPMLLGGENPRYLNAGGTLVAHSGIILSDSHAPGTIPREDLAWAFDFYDHAGNLASGITGFKDIADGSAFIMSCHGPGICADWNPGQGTTLRTFGASIASNGYSAQLITAIHSTPQTVAIGVANQYLGGTPGLTLTNAPTGMQGNGTFTVAGIFRYDGGSTTAPLWITGDVSSSSTSVALQYTGAGTNLELGWGPTTANRWRFNSGFSMTSGSWYFIACTVQANGATPVAHMWTGVGGTLVDKIAGVSRASTGGSQTQTPNVAATPMSLGMYTGSSGSVNASYAGLFVYNRALGQAEVGLMYNTMKAKMAARKETLQ
jgi:hypothetical protein